MALTEPEAATLAGLSESAASVKELALEIATLKQQTIEAEAAVLAAIINHLAPVTPILSQDLGAASIYRPELVICTKSEHVPFPLEPPSSFFSEHRLILHEDGLLCHYHRFGSTSPDGHRPGWEMVDEDVVEPITAIRSFTLESISRGLQEIFTNARQTVILKSELEERLKALSRALEALA
jgi:hypothetical protein